VLAAVTGLLFTAVWNYGVTSMTTWRQERRSSEKRARQRMEAGALQAGRQGDGKMPAKTM
jgi:hypothetical protein